MGLSPHWFDENYCQTCLGASLRLETSTVALKPEGLSPIARVRPVFKTLNKQ